VPAGGILINSDLRGSGKTYTNNEWKMTLAAAPFPGTEQVTSLTDEMKLPNYCFWNGSTAKETGFMLNSISENEEAGTISFTVASQETMGIATLNVKHGTLNDAAVYDLQGRKVANPTKGLYIVNGKLFVAKNTH
jgi:hypothetical protein